MLCTPSLIGLISTDGRMLPLAPRIALRDAARNRAAAAPAISAVMAAVAGAVLLGTYVDSESGRSAAAYEPLAPLGTVIVTDSTSGDVRSPQIPAALSERTGSRDAAEIHVATCPDEDAAFAACGISLLRPPANLCPQPDPGTGLTPDDVRRMRADERCNQKPRNLDIHLPRDDLVDDGSALPILTGATGEDLTEAIQTLRAGGVVVRNPLDLADGKATLQVTDPETGLGRTVTVPGHVLTSGVSSYPFFVSPELVERNGLAIRHIGYATGTDGSLTWAEQDALTAIIREVSPGARVVVERGFSGDRGDITLMLALAAGVIALGAAGIATGLTAADSRGDLSTLAAVGATPGVRRRLSLSQAGVTAGLGGLLGVLIGLGSAMAILVALNAVEEQGIPVNHQYPLVVPWNALGLLLLVPLIAMAGAGLLTRSRLPIERRLG